MGDKDKDAETLQNKIDHLRNFNEGARLSMVRNTAGHWAVNNPKPNDRLPNIPELINSINNLNIAVDKLVASNNSTQEILQRQMSLIEHQGKLLEGIELRLLRSEQKQATMESQLQKQNSAIYSHDTKLDQLEQENLAKDVLISGPIITTFLKEQSTISFGCAFSEPTNTKLISDLVNSEIGKAVNTPKSVQVATYSKVSVKDRPDMLMLTFGSSHEKLYVIRSLAKGRTGDIYCTERMTRNRQEIHYRLRQLRKNSPDSGLMVIMRNGCPAVRFGMKGKVRLIQSPDELECFSKWFAEKFPQNGQNKPPSKARTNSQFIEEPHSNRSNAALVGSAGGSQVTPMEADDFY